MTNPRRNKSDLHEDYSGPKWAWGIIWSTVNKISDGKFKPNQKISDKLAQANMAIEFIGEENE